MDPKHGEAVHRGLHLVTPMRRGADIRALQREVNEELTHRRLAWRRVAVDGEFGPRTLRACHFLGWVLGFSGRRLEAMRGDAPRLSISSQRRLRDPAARAAGERFRDRLRRPKVAALRRRHAIGPEAAVAYIREMAARGVHEVGTSNTGPRIDEWQAYFGLRGEPWCGCLAGYAAKAVGGSGATTWFPYGPSIIADARSGRNGVYAVGFDEAEAGDILVFWDGAHIGTALGRPTDGTIASGEGNTSPSSADSQADGGCVALKARARADVSCVARVY